MAQQGAEDSERQLPTPVCNRSSSEIAVQHDPQQGACRDVRASAGPSQQGSRLSLPRPTADPTDNAHPSSALEVSSHCEIDFDQLNKKDSSLSSRSSSSSQKAFLSEKKVGPSFSEIRQKRGLFVACTRFIFNGFKKNWGTLAFLVAQAIGFALLGIFAFDPLPWQAWYSFAVLGITIAVLVANLTTPMLAMLLAVTALLVAKVITPSSAFKGLANEGIIAVCIFFVVAEAIRQTAVLSPIFWYLLGNPRSSIEAHTRLVVPTALVSSFFYNTPLVAILIPVLQAWSRRSGFPISRLLMPLNHAAALGGTLTLLGTSTNLVLDTLVRSSNILNPNKVGPAVGLPIFGITPVGAVVAGVGLVYLAVFSRFLRTERVQETIGAVIQNARRYTVSLKITEQSSVVGKPLRDVGFHHLRGLFLIKLTRADGEVLATPEPNTVLQAGDIILVNGVVETLTEMYHIRGVVPANEQSEKLKLDRNEKRLVEVVISKYSNLVGKGLLESAFASRFSAAVIGFCGQSEYFDEEIEDVKLCGDDRLLLETRKDFVSRFGEDANFDYVEEVPASQPPREDLLHRFLAAGIVVGMVVIATVNLLPLVTTAAIAAFLMVATGCVTGTQAGKSVNWPVIITIAAGFGISRALDETGAAAALGKFILRICHPLGEIGLLFGIYFATALVTSLITSNAAVALMFPIIVEILNEQGSSISNNNKLRALYALMLGGSSMFSTPIAFQTNMMVHGPGGYTFLDWVLFGVPLQIITGTAGVVALRVLRFSS